MNPSPSCAITASIFCVSRDAINRVSTPTTFRTAAPNLPLARKFIAWDLQKNNRKNRRMTWFEELTGFAETSPDDVRNNIAIDGESLISRINSKRMLHGRLETPSLGELRQRVGMIKNSGGRISAREVIANVQNLHADPANAGALFQVASQFNLLEMVSPSVTPERGIGIYEMDRTQGPACAIAAGAGTIYRNYFAPVNGRIGQSENNQIDCLADLGKALGNIDNRLWQMRNGYALASASGLIEISNQLKAASANELDGFRALLRIGIQWNTQVTLHDCAHQVTQTYCSALPVAYSRHSTALWEDFARLVLEASYEATLCAAISNSLITGNNKVFLTLLGGGAFGNATDWIIAAMKRALFLYQDWNLDVAIISYRVPNREIQKLAAQFDSRQ
jgi:hypothetical protein